MKPTIIFDHVSKKFSRTYVSDSLRDALATPFKKLLGRNGEPHKENKEFWALKDVSFEVRPGEALGIIGPNGSGKSTTLKLLSRILRPDGGRIIVKGRVGALIELGAGFHLDLTGRENIFLNASILGMSREEIAKKYDEIVDFAELHEFMDTPVKWYSSGMYARLGFSVAANMVPEILLVDEVLSVGDVGFQRKCFDKMRYFKDQGIAIVFVSHNLKAVASLCDRVIMFHRGTKAYEGNSDDTISYYYQRIYKDNSADDEQIQLIDVAVSDETGRPCRAFSCGQRAKVDVVFKFNKKFSNLYVTVGVLAADKSLVFWTDSISLTGNSLSVSEGQVYSFPIELTLNLNQGHYEFITSVFDRSKGQTIFRKSFSPFIIEQHSSSSRGTVYLAPRLVSKTGSSVSDEQI